MTSRRTDELGRAFKGSQLQMQIYVNRRRRDLNAKIAAAFPELADASFTWHAPLEREKFTEPQDGELLKAIDEPGLRESLKEFWPSRGPVWDGVATIRLASGKKGVLLAEGKSYPDEFFSKCQAKDPNSRTLIDKRLAETQRWLGVRAGSRWAERLYQSANRYAHLYWLRKVEDIPTWLVHVLFTDDERHHATTRDQWEQALRSIEVELGHPATGFAGHVFLPACSRDELIS